MEFNAFQKIPRLSREMIVTEKIDGTNGIIGIETYGRNEDKIRGEWPVTYTEQVEGGTLCIFAGSRTKWVTPGKNDNAGFAGWVLANAQELKKLGDGYHYGEWWGKKIQRGYDLQEKRFSLFNVSRWTDDVRPACCYVVPLLYTGQFSTESIDRILDNLRIKGSLAAPGYMIPEGVVIFHVPSGYLFKKTIEKDEQPKGQP